MCFVFNLSHAAVPALFHANAAAAQAAGRWFAAAARTRRSFFRSVTAAVGVAMAVAVAMGDVAMAVAVAVIMAVVGVIVVVAVAVSVVATVAKAEGIAFVPS